MKESNMTINHLSDLADLADPGICEQNKKSVLENENNLEIGRSDKSDKSDSRYIKANSTRFLL
ncbi:MAG: hypothetical protein JO297_09350 [Nitrososphaeraceae archaeon]|nr:hypothetical protein [Nitrososphaeraceae archaeon]